LKRLKSHKLVCIGLSERFQVHALNFGREELDLIPKSLQLWDRRTSLHVSTLVKLSRGLEMFIHPIIPQFQRTSPLLRTRMRACSSSCEGSAIGYPLRLIWACNVPLRFRVRVCLCVPVCMCACACACACGVCACACVCVRGSTACGRDTPDTLACCVCEGNAAPVGTLLVVR
jgi:hypothetical protein